ncbi:putative peptide ABC transporter, ATP-binding protein [Nostocoides japonicum T1-X7]|uniref:Putative peptide ABC transporter, ATP-binding protein n=1 Tax=Nostocoides japonicum T1-X7 TaxID=1194083 RepID=A0A077LXW6_9MICO|nr:ATP-binding cassette domain-containing protein [Tetrasphaera japonica]CCH78536.1 putative peptide ABC transporter, ATP-binding protein [Tetrasphaera japonica T1-X7]
MIRLDKVTLTYPDGDRRLVAVDHAILTIEHGKVLGVTGPSGSGKSSLLALAALLIRPDSGRVVIDNVDTSTLDGDALAALRRDRVGIVFQQPNLLPALTAREQLVVMGELSGPSSRAHRAARRRRADALLDAVGLLGQADRRPAELSGGQRQRVNLARALMNEPSLLLVDEPTSALDRERGAAVVDLVVRLTHQLDVATLLVSHEQSDLDRADAVHTMVDGRLRDDRSLLSRPRREEDACTTDERAHASSAAGSTTHRALPRAERSR